MKKKLLSTFLSLSIILTMFFAFEFTASANIGKYPTETYGSTDGFWNYGYFTGYVVINSVDELDEFQEKWNNTTEYDDYQLIVLWERMTLTKNYDFTKGDKALSVEFRLYNSVIEKGATLKAKKIIFTNNNTINNGTIISTAPQGEYGIFSFSDPHATPSGTTNNGVIKLLNTDYMRLYATKELNQYFTYPLLNNGIIETATGVCKFDDVSKSMNKNGDVFINPNSSGIVKIADKNTEFYMNAQTIEQPIYMVTIPETIDFGAVSKKMKNDTDANKIAKVENIEISADYQNLFANEKQLTVKMNSDFKVKHVTEITKTLDFNLYTSDGNVKQSDGSVALSIAPDISSPDNTNQTQKQSYYATLDQSMIKFDGNYSGTITFTLEILDK